MFRKLQPQHGDTRARSTQGNYPACVVDHRHQTIDGRIDWYFPGIDGLGRPPHEFQPLLFKPPAMNRKILVACLAIATCCVRSGTAADTVRVQVTSGVPQLVVDGKPVRARVFFGIPGARPKAIGPEAQLIAFEFQPLESEPARATMHLRFGEIPGRVYLDDIQVQDLTSGDETITLCNFEQGKSVFDRDWIVWPTGDENTVGQLQVVAGAGRDGSRGLCVELQKPTRGNWPDFHIYHRPNLALNRDHRYRVSLWVRSEQQRNLTLAFYRPGEQFTFLGGPPGCFESQIKLAADVGVDLVSFPLRMPWPREGTTIDWTSVERQCQAVIDANPRALLLPRVWMGAPRWWLEEHPDERMVWDKEPTEHTDVVVASNVWRTEAARRLTALIQRLESKFADHMAGYHPTGQNTGEWFYQNTWGPALNGYSASSRRAWCTWLKERYRDDAGLQAAWRDPLATLDTAAVPPAEARRGSPYGLLRDPKHERPLLDFAQFQQEMMADCVCHFAKTVRQATRGTRLVVVFYGYSFEFAAIRDGAAIAGHYGLRRVLQSPDVDMLCSPISYFDRALGGSGPAMTAAESVAMAGKMWLVEDDTRTYLGTGNFPGWQDGVDNIEDTNALLLRNTGQCALRNLATWWMDLGGTGWFDDARMWAEMQRLQHLDQSLLETPRPFRPEVAAVVDERSMILTAGGSYRLTRPLVYEARRPLGRMGTAYGQYLLDDVIAGRTTAKLFVFLSAWSLSADQREKLLDATRGKVSIWCYAPGYYDEEQLSLAAMQQLTGFRMKRISVEKAWAMPTERGRLLGMSEGLGTEAAIEPLFAVSDAKPGEVLATYSDGSTAVAMRKTTHGVSLFVGPPGLSSSFLRLAAHEADVHLYTESDCNIYANGPYLVVHASQDGPVELNTGADRPIVDLLTGKELGQGPRFELTLEKGETRVLATR